MFERQIRLSRYDADKLFNSSTPAGSRVSSQHREISSPTRSRSISPNDMAIRQRRTAPTVPSGSSLPPPPTLSLPIQTSYPDVVISHTPPTETNKNLNDQIYNDNLAINNQGINKDKKVIFSNRNSFSSEQIPLNIIVDDNLTNQLNQQRPNLLLPSTNTSETVDCQPLDFKSRLALFNRTNTQQSNDISKKTFNSSLTKPNVIVHQSNRLINDEKKDFQTDLNQLPISISRSVVNTAKAVTFFGGNKLNGNTKSSLPVSIPPPPPPSSSTPSVSNQINNKIETISNETLHPPSIIGGNVKLNKSSIYSGTKKVLNFKRNLLFNITSFSFIRMLMFNLLIM